MSYTEFLFWHFQAMHVSLVYLNCFESQFFLSVIWKYLFFLFHSYNTQRISEFHDNSKVIDSNIFILNLETEGQYLSSTVVLYLAWKLFPTEKEQDGIHNLITGQAGEPIRQN